MAKKDQGWSLMVFWEWGATRKGLGGIAGENAETNQRVTANDEERAQVAGKILTTGIGERKDHKAESHNHDAGPDHFPTPARQKRAGRSGFRGRRNTARRWLLVLVFFTHGWLSVGRTGSAQTLRAGGRRGQSRDRGRSSPGSFRFAAIESREWSRNPRI